MKKSELTVNMPMTTYEQMNAYKDRLVQLRTDLAGLFTREGRNAVVFDAKTAMEICREMLPSDMQNLIVRIAY